ncbi:flavin reductase [Actinoplanes sp. NPDC051859]|uniref:flavin reductase n=1 Tax=Actinoplanes sp. NPDC051859 TaxID=3363909 RepID=UPI003792B5AD
MSLHQPVRPRWICSGCGADWPCPTRRQQLTAEYAGARVSLMVYLTACFVQACEDAQAETVGDLYHRFLSWPECRAR